MTCKWAILPCVFAGLMVSCKNDLDRVAAIEVGNNGPERITKGAEYIYSDSGAARNRLRAGTIMEYAGNKARTELLDGVELLFFNPDGTVGSRLTSRRGAMDPATGRMTVEEKVVFVNAKGEKLETEFLAWSQDSGRVYTDRPVKITRARDIVYGQGLDAAEDFGRYTVRRITGTLFIEGNDTLGPRNNEQ